ncbi:glycosyltransferase family 4 protein [Neorhodopirellula pilleata]|nr:glycosyltransferase [Neorhodopirellula pilleata]
MKIALIIPTMDRGGAEKQVVLLAIGLKDAGHDVRVMLLTRDGPRSDELRSVGIPVDLIGKKFKGDLTSLWRLKKRLIEFQPDVVHTWLFAANSFGRVAALMARVPVIIASERCVDPWKRRWHFIIDRYLAKRSQAITTNSEGVRDFYANHGLDPRQFEIIPNGVTIQSNNAPTNLKTRDEVLSKLSIDPHRKMILAVGRLWPQKRVRDLIWAGELIATLRGDVTLLIVGDGPERDELIRHRDAVSQVEHVRFAGQRDDVADLLAHADAFWIASEYEGQSNAVIEAMLACVPVFASDIPGNRDLIIDGETGWLFQLGSEAELVQKTNEMFNAPETATRVTLAAKDRIETEFTVNAMVQRHLQLYERLKVD